MRTLEGHKINPVNDQIRIEVMDEPGQGGACHEYQLSWPLKGSHDGFADLRIGFQNGPIAEYGVNGVTQEALLAILIDRLECFQAGPYACLENAVALTHLEEAMKALLSRTKARMARGVEGTHEK